MARYFPFAGGRYEMTPGLFKLGQFFGNGLMDSRVLQIDEHYGHYRKQKLLARSSDFDRHVCKNMLTDQQEARVNRILMQHLVNEYPEYFSFEAASDITGLRNRITGEVIVFDNEARFVDSHTTNEPLEPAYLSGIDALACQFQEDFCIISAGAESSRLQYAHICFPNNWLAKDKIGQDFMSLHQPVAGFQKVNPNGHKIIAGLLRGGPYVRFAWGLSNDVNLSHPPGLSPPIRSPGENESLYIRVERQVLQGIPDLQHVLFFIRSYYYDCEEVMRNSDLNRALQNALLGMGTEILRYKGLAQHRDEIVDWLRH